MPGTSIPAVKAAILDVLEGAKGLVGIAITDDHEPERDEEYIWIVRAKATRTWAGVGGKPPPLDELVKVLLRIVSIEGGDSSKPSEERALELADIAEAALREATTLNGAIRFQHAEELEAEPQTFDRKRGCHVLMTISAKARI